MAIATGMYDPVRVRAAQDRHRREPSSRRPPAPAGCTCTATRAPAWRWASRRPAGQLVGGVGANMGALAKYDMVLLPCDDDSHEAGRRAAHAAGLHRQGRPPVPHRLLVHLAARRDGRRRVRRPRPLAARRPSTWATTTTPSSTRASPRARPSPSGCGSWAPRPTLGRAAHPRPLQRRQLLRRGGRADPALAVHRGAGQDRPALHLQHPGGRRRRQAVRPGGVQHLPRRRGERQPDAPSSTAASPATAPTSP